MGDFNYEDPFFTVQKLFDDGIYDKEKAMKQLKRLGFPCDEDGASILFPDKKVHLKTLYKCIRASKDIDIQSTYERYNRLLEEWDLLRDGYKKLTFNEFINFYNEYSKKGI